MRWVHGPRVRQICRLDHCDFLSIYGTLYFPNKKFELSRMLPAHKFTAIGDFDVLFKYLTLPLR